MRCMLRDRETRAQAPGPSQRASWGRLPWVPATLLVGTLLVALIALIALIALLAVIANHQPWRTGLVALALLLLCAAALAAGALWARQRQHGRLHQAQGDQHLLAQLLDVWYWQTDAGHRLIKLQPPQGAPASAWAAAALDGQWLWQRFEAPDDSLRPRLLAEAPLGDLRVRQARPDGQPGQAWRLRGLPRFDGRGRFAGHLGVAWPTDLADAHHTVQLALEALLGHGPGALCLALPAAQGDGWVLARANPAALALLGLPGLPAGGLPWAEALAGLPAALATQASGLQPGQGWQGDGWQLRLDSLAAAGDGQRPALLLSMAGAPAAADATLADLHAAQQAANQAASQAAAAEQAAFSYTISHDLRAPIRVIEGFGRILKEDYAASLDRVGRDHLDRVMAAAARMNHMIDALLSLSRLSTQPLLRQPVNLSQLAGFVIDDLRRGAPDRQVNVVIEPGLLTEGDPTLLRLVLDNLLGNAWKYSARVAHARISFERLPATAGPGGRVVYQVRDNGAGFDMRFADRLFGVFQRLHSSSDFQGHGVGLASVRRIVQRHGGEVWAEGEVGVGARFSFTLKA